MKELTYPTNLDEIDQWLSNNFGLLPGCCSSIEELRHSTARMVAEVLWPKKAPVQEGLDDAAKEYASHIRITDTKRINGADEWLYLFSDLLDAFKAGSAYQADQDNRDVVFWQGMREGVKRMKKEGVTGIITTTTNLPIVKPDSNVKFRNYLRTNFKDGDKVRIIVLKDERP